MTTARRGGAKSKTSGRRVGNGARKGLFIQTRLPPDIGDAVKKIAAEEHRSLSSYFKHLVLKDVETRRQSKPAS